MVLVRVLAIGLFLGLFGDDKVVVVVWHPPVSTILTIDGLVADRDTKASIIHDHHYTDSRSPVCRF